MVKNDLATLKKTRVKLIAKEVFRLLKSPKHKGKLSTPNFLDWIEYEIGLGRKTARTYLDLIGRVHPLKISDEYITKD